MTADLKDLKEELRGNLASRAAELEAKGTDAASAATTAFAELGDIHELIAGVGAESGSRTTTAEGVIAAARNRVKPRPWYVVRAVLFSLVIAAGAAAVTLGALQLISWGVVGAVVLALAVGALTDDSLRQETSSHYRAPNARAIGWGLSSAAVAAGLSFGALLFAGFEVWLLVACITLALAGVVAFVWLGVTQTNRLKPWALDQQRSHEFEDRFSKDPAAAARFGMFTVVIWTLAITAFIVLSITVGFLWSWLAIVGGFVVFFLVLAKMLFPADK
jgi:MFS family permease